MKKKITALILVIPLIFMFTVFSAGQAAAISVPVSVSSISIDNKPENDTYYANIATYDKDGGVEPFVFKVTVNPSAATNQNYKFSSSNPNIATVDSNNKLCVHDVGKVDITVRSENGGFIDKMAVVVTSTIVLRYNLLFKDSNGDDVTLTAVSGNDDYQYKAQVNTGAYTFREKDVHPSTVENYGAVYSSSNTNVATISPIGDVVFRSGGSTILSCEIQGIKKSVLVEAISPATTNDSGIAVEGKDNAVFQLSTTETKFEALLETANPTKPKVVEKSDVILNVGFDQISGTSARSTTMLWQIVVILRPGEKPADEVISVTLNCGKAEDYKLSFIFADSVLLVYSQDSKDLAGGEDGTKVEMLKLGEEYVFYPQILPESPTADYQYIWQSTNDKISFKNEEKGFVKISATDVVTEATISLTIMQGETQVGSTYEFKVTFINFYELVNIEDTGRGIENVLAIGEKHYQNGQLTGYQHQFKTKVDAQNFALSADEFEVTSSKNIKAEIVDGKIVLTEILSNEIEAWVKVEWKYNYLKNTEVMDTFYFNAIDEGVQVSTSADLAKATMAENEGKGLPVVLSGNVMLDENLEVQKIKTTADWTHYKNMGKGRPNVKYLIEFKNSVFGNGYFISAHNVTTKIVGDFYGPLNFVSLYMGGDVMASVKAQDNICFLVRNDDVIVDNVELRGCEDSYLEKEVNGVKEYRINELNNIGTVLELMSDAKVLNSRIRNGRTCIRAFGRYIDENPVVKQQLGRAQVAAERISPVISNCIIQQAREFLLKVGANRAIQCSENLISPSLGGYSLPTSSRSNMDDENFYRDFVMTDITVKDTVFETSGLFCIGVETHFAGDFLDNAVSPEAPLWKIDPFDSLFTYSRITEILAASKWDNLAATSYASKITLEGDVEFLDWKVKENIDSSTLIELGMDVSFLKLRVNKMVEYAAKNNSRLDVLFDSYKKDPESNRLTEVLHGGICFYGGGKNYSEVVGANADLMNFNVNLSSLAPANNPTGEGLSGDDLDAFRQGMFLPYAAGTEDFRFMMYTKNGGHSYSKVQDLIKNGVVNDIVYTTPAKPAEYIQAK
ncbi:MAG: hypothetical protein E7344_03285 [Clostridiales bacterium]|nr:hypothetical protein [Clostridiales bacterium]